MPIICYLGNCRSCSGNIELLKEVAEEMPEEESFFGESQVIERCNYRVTELPVNLCIHLFEARLMISEEFEGHFQRTIDSGLWRPG